MNLNMTVAQAHADYCVDILSTQCTLATVLNARWLRLAFAESYRLLRVNQTKELVTVCV